MEIKSPYANIRSPYEDSVDESVAPPETQTPQPTRPSVPAPMPGAWDRFKTQVVGDITEPFKIGGEILSAPVNALAKGWAGAKGLAAGTGAKLGGATWDEAAQEAQKEFRTAPLINAPQSRFSKYVGENVVSPIAGAAGRMTGHPELVNAGLEAAGDISSLFGIKPGLNVAKTGAKAGIQALGKTQLPERLYGSAAKLPLSKAWTREIGPGGMTKRKEAVRAGLEGEVPISELGIAKAKNLESAHRALVDSAVQQLDNGGFLIPKERLKAGLDKAYQVAGEEGTASAQRIVDSLFDKRFEKMGREVKVGERQIPAEYTTDPFGQKMMTKPARVEPIYERMYTPSEMQTIKRHLYKMENYERAKLSRGLASQLKELGNKGMAKEAKLALEQLKPELKRLNRQDAAYINLIEALERAVPRLQNKDMVGIGTKILATSASPSLALVEHILGLPYVKSKLAFAINRARKAPPVAPVSGDVARVAAVGQEKAVTPDETRNPKPVAAPQYGSFDDWANATYEEPDGGIEK